MPHFINIVINTADGSELFQLASSSPMSFKEVMLILKQLPFTSEMSGTFISMVVDTQQAENWEEIPPSNELTQIAQLRQALSTSWDKILLDAKILDSLVPEDGHSKPEKSYTDIAEEFLESLQVIEK